MVKPPEAVRDPQLAPLGARITVTGPEDFPFASLKAIGEQLGDSVAICGNYAGSKAEFSEYFL